MDDIKIITVYVIIADILSGLGHQSHQLAQVSDAEILTIAVVSAMYFQNHHQQTLFVMRGLRYITRSISTSRFSRRLHALAQLLEYIVGAVGQLFAQGEVFIIDSLPLPVCKSVRATRCRKINGSLPCARAYFGKCAAKRWAFFGWRLHLICTPQGVPVTFQMLPASWHDLSPIYELTMELPTASCVYADKGYISSLVKRTLRPAPSRHREGVYLVAWHKKSMQPNTFEEWCGLKRYRHLIETALSQLVSMGIQRLHARTNQGFSIKVLASLLALTCTNLY